MILAVANFDGGNRGNPGPHACAVTMDVMRDTCRCVEEVRYLGDDGTNNVAEWNGLILALEMAEAQGVTHLAVRADSKLVVEQALGNWQVKNARLAVLRDQATKLAEQFVEVTISHVPREENKRADRLCTDLLDSVVGRKRGS